MNEVQEAAALETVLDGLGAEATADQIIQAIEGFSDLAIAAALRRLGGGGGTQTIQTAQVVFDNDAIIALPNGGVAELLPAPGAGKIYLFIGGYAFLDATAGAYGDLADDFKFAVNYGTSFQSGISSIYSEDAQGAFADASAIHVLGPFVSGTLGTITANRELSAAWLADGVAGNVPLGLKGWNATLDAPLSGGNAANTLTFSFCYSILDII